MGTTAEKLTYLNTTKGKIKDSINLTGAGITSSDTFRSYATKLKQGLINALNDNGETIISNFPKVSGKGSNLSLTPTYEAPMGISVYGDTYQNGTPTPSSPIPINNATGLQNVNVCGKNLFNKDTITTGQYIDASGNLVNDNSNFVGDYIPIDITKSYYASQNAGGVIRAGYYDSNKTFISRQLISANYGSLTIPNNAVYVRLSCYNQSLDTLQLEIGSSSTTYESFNGTTYDINLGKNLLPNLGTSQIINGVAFTKNEDGSVLVNGTSTDTIFYDIIPANSYQINTNNTFLSGCPTGGSTTSYELRVVYTNNTNDRDVGSGIALANKTLKQVMIRLQSGMTFNNLLFKPMIEKGTQATSYSPYFTPIELNKIGDYEDSIKKSTGKNLFDKNNFNELRGTIDIATLKFTYSSTSMNYCFYMPCKPNTTYTIQKRNDGDTNRFKFASCSTTISTQDSGITNLTTGESNDSASSLTITTGPNDIYLLVQYYRSAETKLTKQQLLDSIMINEGSTALPYEPYGKVWYVEKQTGRYNIDTSQITLRSNYTNVEYAQIPKASDYIGYNVWGASTYLCSHAQWSVNATNWDSVDNINKIYSGANLGQWWIGFTKGTGLSNIQTALTGGYIIYPLAIPTYTTITNEELIKELESIKSKNGTTNISVSSEYLPAILGCSALKVEE